MPAMTMAIAPYAEQMKCWPQTGQHILAQFDDETIIVYQAYRPAIGRFAVENGFFGGDFKYSRMSWIKPNFLWMMYRCGWGTKPDQEVVLAVRLRRAGFDEILAQAVPSRFESDLFATPAAFRDAIANSSVRLQWDPDHDPAGAPVERRAIQLGLRGEVLRRYAREWIVDIQDVSPFIAGQRAHAGPAGWPELVTPREEAYPVTDPQVAWRLGLSD